MKRDDQLFKRGAKDSAGRPIVGSGPEGECRVPWCTKKGSHPKGRRGLCHTHRVYARHAIHKGFTTEEDLIKRGLLLPAKSVNIRKNPTRKSPFDRLQPRGKGKLKRKTKKPKGKSKPKASKPKAKAKARKVRRKNPSKRCVFPKCKTQSHAKGLCKPHYSQAKRRLRRLKANPTQKEKLLRDWKRRGLWVEDAKTKKRENPFDLGSKIRGNRRK